MPFCTWGRLAPSCSNTRARPGPSTSAGIGEGLVDAKAHGGGIRRGLLALGEAGQQVDVHDAAVHVIAIRAMAVGNDYRAVARPGRKIGEQQVEGGVHQLRHGADAGEVLAAGLR